jgi:hypothetical protein
MLATADLVALSQKLLVACDQSYAGNNLVVGTDSLGVYNDPPLTDTFQPPYSGSFPQFVVAFTRCKSG